MFREIVTKAVVAKGKKTIELKETVEVESLIHSILGCMVINHEFEAIKNDFDIMISGSFELDIWYSKGESSETDVMKKKVTYLKNIPTKKISNADVIDNSDCIIRILQHPTCTNAVINGSSVSIDIIFEVLVDVIGETTMQISIVDDTLKDEFSEINEDFINE